MVLPVSQHLLFICSVHWHCQASTMHTAGLAATFKASLPQLNHTITAKQQANTVIFAPSTAITHDPWCVCIATTCAAFTISSLNQLDSKSRARTFECYFAFIIFTISRSRHLNRLHKSDNIWNWEMLYLCWWCNVCIIAANKWKSPNLYVVSWKQQELEITWTKQKMISTKQRWALADLYGI